MITSSYKVRTSWLLTYVDLSLFNNESLSRMLSNWSRIGSSFGSKGICTTGEPVILSVVVSNKYVSLSVEEMVLWLLVSGQRRDCGPFERDYCSLLMNYDVR